ncbi:MAG TPA: hypothetical protein VFR86_00160 [Burkholderiaceae bacterium]|nr:hypothetical protein [Burkholderiaceae bacterium]
MLAAERFIQGFAMPLFALSNRIRHAPAAIPPRRNVAVRRLIAEITQVHATFVLERSEGSHPTRAKHFRYPTIDGPFVETKELLGGNLSTQTAPSTVTDAQTNRQEDAA